MAAWWETSGAAGADDKWASAAAADEPSAATSDVAKKIEQLRGGKWTEEWKEFEYYDDAAGAWVKSALDTTLGRKGWWPFLWHDGQEWQPEALADHLEKQGGTDGAAAASGEAASQWGSTAAASTSWGNWGAAADSGEQAAFVPNAKAYWEMQQWNTSQGILSRKTEEEMLIDDAALFTERLGSNAGIDFKAYDNVPVDVSGNNSDKIVPMPTFDEIYVAFREMIPDACIQNVRRCQYSVPTPVQKYALPCGLAGRDVMCCAQTGSGKTAAFLIPTIGLMMKHHEHPTGLLEEPFQGKCKPDTLVMTPTRELCIQIHEEALKFCHRTGYRCCRVYGGEPPKVQLEDLCKGCDLMVACPGRLVDFINREVIEVSQTYVLVLDEADRMLDMGFEKQIRDVVENYGMPKNEDRQTMMFSATFPKECQEMAQDFLYEYIWIGVGIVGGAVSTVTQTLRKVKPASKYEVLIEILDEFYRSKVGTSRCLVFVNAKDTAKWLDEQLYDKAHFETGALHGNLTQAERETSLARFRKGDIDVMVATDVASRGLDIESVDLIINYDMPNELDTYVHRIGRSGRIGNRGAAITFISTDDDDKAYENLDILGKLLTIMQEAGSDVPDWLEDQVQHSAETEDNNGSWANWGGKDYRGDANWWENQDQPTQ